MGRLGVGGIIVRHCNVRWGWGNGTVCRGQRRGRGRGLGLKGTMPTLPGNGLAGQFGGLGRGSGPGVWIGQRLGGMSQ